MTDWTPGPYWLETEKGVHTLMARHPTTGNPFPIAYECVYGRGVGYKPLMAECAAVFNLLASAPDLYAALAAAVEIGLVPKSSAAEGGANKFSGQVRVADQIRAVLAKARGESE